jgi:type II secretory pathway component PulL
VEILTIALVLVGGYYLLKILAVWKYNHDQSQIEKLYKKERDALFALLPPSAKKTHDSVDG